MPAKRCGADKARNPRGVSVMAFRFAAKEERRFSNQSSALGRPVEAATDSRVRTVYVHG